MADGYARLSGRPGFVYGQHGPGVSNVAGALADPFWAMSPVVSLTSATTLLGRDLDGYQDLDGLALHAPLTRWNKSLYEPSHAYSMLRSAICAATGPVTGPVHLEIPSEMLSQECSEARSVEDHPPDLDERRIAPNATGIEKIVDALVAAERPVILAGGGVMTSQAWEDLCVLADALSVPVGTSLSGKGSIDESHDLSIGAVGRYSRWIANEVISEADVILAIGTRLGTLVTSGWMPHPKNARLLQIDTDYETLGRHYSVDVSVQADASLACRAAVGYARAHGLDRPRTSWALEVGKRVEEWRAEFAVLADLEPDDGIHPAAVLSDLRKVLRPEDIVVTDTGASARWGGALFSASKGRHFLRAAGSLGWAVPGAMGAALAAPGQRVVAFTGDGGVCYHIGELETAIRCEIPIVIVILNNRCLASESHSLKRNWNRELPEVMDYSDIDYPAIARGFGAFGVRVSERKDIVDSLRAALDFGGPAVVEIRSSKEADSHNQRIK
jgi:acetolactate synthase-1/2/3 large subunit